jgi:hypothetical protein
MKRFLLIISILIFVIIMQSNSVISKMANAIKEFEGWVPGSRSYRNNNPGNLKYAGQKGATGQDETGHAIFDTYQSGWNALMNQLKLAFSGTSLFYNPAMSLYEFFGKYAEGNSVQYAQYVAGKLGVSPDSKLSQLS